MNDSDPLLATALEKRERAAFLRRVAASLSLKNDQDTLLAHARALEAEASAIERDAQGRCSIGA